jgi:hypothetical protein
MSDLMVEIRLLCTCCKEFDEAIASTFIELRPINSKLFFMSGCGRNHEIRYCPFCGTRITIKDTFTRSYKNDKA